MLNVFGTLRSEFRHRAESAYRKRLLNAEREKQKRLEKREEIEKEAAEFMDVVISFVTTTEIESLRADLDIYDAATVAALQENEKAMELVQARLDKLLSQAYVMPDGRRVFKTEDGLRVFDEFGTELGASVIDPDVIPNDRPRWEAYKSQLDEKTRLFEERRALLEYQSKLDEARERLDQGDITREEFDRLENELKASMPEAVRKHIPDMEPESTAATDLAAGSTAKLNPDLEFPSDMIPASMIPR